MGGIGVGKVRESGGLDLGTRSVELALSWRWSSQCTWWIMYKEAKKLVQCWRVWAHSRATS